MPGPLCPARVLGSSAWGVHRPTRLHVSCPCAREDRQLLAQVGTKVRGSMTTRSLFTLATAHDYDVAIEVHRLSPQHRQAFDQSHARAIQQSLPKPLGTSNPKPTPTAPQWWTAHQNTLCAQAGGQFALPNHG